jgi:hypothetical protein
MFLRETGELFLPSIEEYERLVLAEQPVPFYRVVQRFTLKRDAELYEVQRANELRSAGFDVAGGC